MNSTFDLNKKTYILLPLVSIAIGIAYSFLVFFVIHFDFYFIAFPCFFLILYGVAEHWLLKYDRKTNEKVLIVLTILSVLLAFAGRIATETFFVYHFQLLPIKGYAAINTMLHAQTGFEGYLGTFLWKLSHTQVTEWHDGTSSTSTSNIWEVIFNWVLEYGLIQFLIIIIMKKELADLTKICEKCGKPKALSTYLVGPFISWKEIKKALTAKNFDAFREYYYPHQSNKHNFTALQAYKCKSCMDTSISLHLVATGGKIGTQQIKTTYSNEDFISLSAIINKSR